MQKTEVHKSFLGIHYYRVGDIAKIEGFGLIVWGRVGDVWKLFPGRA